MNTPSPRARRLMSGGAVLASVLASGLLVWQASFAAFSATTSNDTDSWSAGSVTLSDNDSGIALFSPIGLKPTDTASRCIKVTYGGSLPANVKLYISGGTLTGTGLGSYLKFKVETGTLGDAANCSDFGGTTATAYDITGYPTTGQLAHFAATYQAFSSGLAAWNGATQNTTRTYRFTYTVADDNGQGNGLTVGATLTWEAQNT
jgi:hypothetical protein